MARRVAIIGAGLSRTASRRRDVIYPELTYEAVRMALDMAGLGIHDVQAVVYGSMDPFDGVFAPEKWNVDSCAAAGFLHKPYIKISTGGTTGGSTSLAGYYHVASGMFNVVLAVASQRVGETVDAQQVLNTCMDPVFERDFGAGAITVAAAQATNHMHYYGTTAEDLALVSVKNHNVALKNPCAHLRFPLTVEQALKTRMLSWPLRLSDCCPSSDGACAVVYASEEAAQRAPVRPAWVRGAGQITDCYYMGDRYWFQDWDSLALLAHRVYQAAHIDSPRREVQVVEAYNAFSIQEILEYEALGLAEQGKGQELVQKGITDLNGDLPVCPSGGVLCTNPIGASGLIRVAEAAMQVMGKAGEHQVSRPVRTALAHAWGATIGFHTLMCLGAEKP